MIRVRMLGQFGNQCLIYILAKILADKTGLQYTAPQCFLDKQGKSVKWTGEPLFTMHDTPGRILYGNPHVVDTLQTINFDLIDGTKPVVVKQCYFQRFSQFREYKQRIRDEWLHIPAARYVETDDDAVYVHVRRTDYCEYHPDFVDPRNQGAATTLDEYVACLDGCFPDAKRLVIVTDDPSDEFLSEFNKLDLPWTVNGGTWIDDFALISSCRNLLISQSTFSWLAGFLGLADKVVCPVFPGSFWHRGITDDRYPHLLVDDDVVGRWTWVGA